MEQESGWEELRKEARKIEGDLDVKLSSYAKLGARVTQQGSPLKVHPNNFACNFLSDNSAEVVSSATCIQSSPSDLPIPASPDEVPYFVYKTPNGTSYWVPNVPPSLKPVVHSSFSKWEDALEMYNAYAFEAGFSVRIAQQKKKNGYLVYKYIRCNRASKPQMKRKFNTLDESTLFLRQSSFKVSDCKAHILLQFQHESPKCSILKFCEYHNHPLVEKYNRDLTKNGRKLSFSSKQFIHKMSLNRIGPTISHRLLVAMKGGHHNVQGTPTDFKNFGQSVRLHIGDRDSSMLLDRLRERLENYPEFYYDFTLVDGQLRSVFWADEIMKLNYQAFGDVLAFDATYHTNKYNMIFVPFTGVDHHKKCVTFGAGILFNETVESYKWLLKCFLKAHGKQPLLVLTDQDPSMKIAVPEVFTKSRHRLCMWHIMKKLPSKVCGDVLQNTDLRSLLHRLVWSVYMKESTFETRWSDMISKFHLEDNNWLNDMFEIRALWVPAYFRDVPMCCLMKTTSRCESSNSSFKVNSSGSNTLVQFLLCFDTSLESQRYRQRLAEFKSSSTPFSSITNLAIEKHAFEIYTHAISSEVTKEIAKGKLSCYISNRQVLDGIEVFSVSHLNKGNETVNVFEVKFNSVDQSASCSCMGFNRIGYLCRHIFCVYRVSNIQRIPNCYIAERWKKDVLPKRIFAIENHYGVDNSPTSVLRNEILDLITDCIYVLRLDMNALSSFASQLKIMKSSIIANQSVEHSSPPTGEVVVEEIIGQSLSVDVTASNPQGIRKKGCGKSRRVVGQCEVAVEKSKKAPRLCRTCNKYVIGHDSRNCDKVSKQAATGCNDTDDADIFNVGPQDASKE